ncbi:MULTISPECIES: CU044_2847 family protein [unclassified Nonomuraea]|uniref:CU044_2847 family protein n=2 Tax=Nonomuraea TaxID=83681 RepID=UPI0034256A32
MALMQLIRFESEDGADIYVEIDDNEPGVVAASRLSESIAAAAGSLEGGLDQIRGLARTTFDRLVALPHPPDEVNVEFGVRLNAKVGAVIAHSEGEGHLKVSMTWRRVPDDPA